MGWYPISRVTTGVHINPLECVVHLNVTKLGDANGRPYNLADPAQLSEAECVGRRQVYARRLRSLSYSSTHVVRVQQVRFVQNSVHSSPALPAALGLDAER